MFEDIKSYHISYIQKASPSKRDAFNVSHIYKFFTDGDESYQRLKYIVRVEHIYEHNILLVKFYASRDKKLDDKYGRILKAHTYKKTLRIFFTCATLIPKLLKENPTASFVVKGAQSRDLDSDKIEGEENNQRFRIYRFICTRLFGTNTFVHYEFPEISTLLLLNKTDCRSKTEIESKKNLIRATLINVFDV